MSSNDDVFVDMVTEQVDVDLPISQYEARSMLKLPVHVVSRPKFPGRRLSQSSRLPPTL